MTFNRRDGVSRLIRGRPVEMPPKWDVRSFVVLL
jgi:hypothetical protein